MALDLIIWLALVGCNTGLGLMGVASSIGDILNSMPSYRWSEISAEVTQRSQRGQAVVALTALLT